MLKIGIILTRVKSEKKKDELVSITSRKRPWLKYAYDKKKHKHLSIKRDGKRCVPGDVSVGLYILWNWKNVEVDFITPEEIDIERLKSNAMNFMLIYDLLESFHVDKPELFKKVDNALKKCGNVYPPYNYQKFINNKCSYINHLDKKNDSVIPTKCIMTSKCKKIGIEKCIDELKEHIKTNEWNKFIGKPVYGQESIDFKKFNKFNKNSLMKYMKHCFDKYPGIIFQKYIEGFDASNPEIRLYMIGDKYKYSVVTTNKTVKIPEDEHGTEKNIPKDKLIRKAKQTLNNLPDIKIKGKKLPRLLTRIDISCQKKYTKPWLVNEVEFVPSLYLEDVNYIPEIELGDQMIKICKLFKK